MKTLKEVREYLGSIPNINKGGCLISAYAMYLFLKKIDKLPKDFKILQITTSEMQRFLLIRQLQSSNPNNFAAGCEHAMCFTDNVVFDSNESRPLDIDVVATACSVPVDPETQSEYIIAQINTYGWNDAFNRREYIPKIAENLGIDLSMLKLGFNRIDEAVSDRIVEDEQKRVKDAVIEYRKSLKGGTSLITVENKMVQDALSKIFS